MIGAAIGAVGSVVGGLLGSSAARKRNRMIKQQKAKNQMWYNRRYNEDATRLADAQHLLTQTEESIRERNKAAEARQAVTGGTDESLSAAKEANNKALASTMSAIAASNVQRKDNIEKQYMNKDEGYAQQLENAEAQRAQNIAQATQGVLNAASQMDFGSIKLKNGKEISL